jgi:hypothetical protein
MPSHVVDLHYTKSDLHSIYIVFEDLLSHIKGPYSLITNISVSSVAVTSEECTVSILIL